MGSKAITDNLEGRITQKNPFKFIFCAMEMKLKNRGSLC